MPVPIRSRNLPRSRQFPSRKISLPRPIQPQQPKAMAIKVGQPNLLVRNCWLTYAAASQTVASGTSAPLVPRPRLVAKTASGQQASAPKSTNVTSKNGGGSGPDPLQVWNRNRRTGAPSQSGTKILMSCAAAAAAAPKHIVTDEELKQQYGIHLATRLEADGDGKEAKWADIDDDEDDWAPETIEWNDGTKITLPPTDTASIHAQEQAAALVSQQKQDEEAISKMSSPKPTTIVGPNATVLKLGSTAQLKAGGLVLKAPSDKPTLVAKPSAPTPVRSPWASLPPVDKVPPIPINPSSQQSTSRFEQSDRRGSETVPLSAAVQIAADSFTRTRRDTPNGNPGQLYNSQSGQYEPVNGGRRGSMRKEQNFRPPALLQRPANIDQHGPAEPSAAFQTHRSQQDNGMWDRRASSTFSGDSGPRDRRTSMSKGSDQSRIPNDILQQRRESESLQSPLTPGSVQAKLSHRDGSQPPLVPHSQQLNEGSLASGSPQQSKSSLAGNTAAPPGQDEFNAQKQLMREKREAAIKRKKEQEEREEADKRERIRIKMESLGMSPLTERKESKKEILKETEHLDIENKQIEKREVEVDRSEDKGFEAEEPEVNEVEEKKDTLTETVPAQIRSQGPPTSASRSPPKPPVPDASGAPKQYGMMKVHGPPLTNGIPPGERPFTEKVKLSGQHVSPPQHETLPKPAEVITPMVNGDRDVSKQHPEPLIPKSPIARNQDLRAPRQQTWKSVQSEADKFSGWNGAGMTTHSSPVGNLWGPPANQNALGNGTFDRNVQRPQSRQPPYQEHYISPVPQPIGPPRHLQRPRESQESNRVQEMASEPVVEDFQTVPSFPSSEAPPAVPRNRPDPADQLASREQPLKPSHSSPTLQPKLQPIGDQLPRGPDQQRSTLAAWGNFHATSIRDDAEKRNQAAQANAARLAEEARTGVRHEIQLPVMNETWRQIKVDDQANQRKVVSVAKELSVPGSAVGPYMNGDARSMPFGGSSFISATNGAGRSSRFFPGVGQGMHGQTPRAASYTLGFNRSPSPPPPEIGTHPAYARDQDRPVVNLPFAKPKPKVRLPPSFITPVQPPMAEVHVMPLRAVSQPLVNNPTWQDRFNGLLGVKKPSPERKFAHVAEFSSTKVALEVPSAQISAAVSLPPHDETVIIIEEPVTSKDMEDEEALFETREFGDLPVIKIPTQVPETGWQPARPPKSRGQSNKPTKPVEALSRDSFEEKADKVSNGILIFVYMPGAAPQTRKPKTMQMSHGHAPNNRTQRPRHVSGPPKTGKPYKPRDSSATYSSAKPAPNGVQRSPMQNVPSSSPRTPFGKNMNTWSARVAGMAQ